MATTTDIWLMIEKDGDYRIPLQLLKYLFGDVFGGGTFLEISYLFVDIQKRLPGKSASEKLVSVCSVIGVAIKKGAPVKLESVCWYRKRLSGVGKSLAICQSGKKNFEKENDHFELRYMSRYFSHHLDYKKLAN